MYTEHKTASQNDLFSLNVADGDTYQKDLIEEAYGQLLEMVHRHDQIHVMSFVLDGFDSINDDQVKKTIKKLSQSNEAYQSTGQPAWVFYKTRNDNFVQYRVLLCVPVAGVHSDAVYRQYLVEVIGQSIKPSGVLSLLLDKRDTNFEFLSYSILDHFMRESYLEEGQEMMAYASSGLELSQATKETMLAPDTELNEFLSRFERILNA